MRDPRDVLADIFFSRRSLVAFVTATLLGAGAMGLAACQPATPEAAPNIGPAVEAPSLRKVTLRGEDVAQDVWIATFPETGCEYLFVSNSGGLTPNVGRHANGGYVHLGCRLGTTGH